MKRIFNWVIMTCIIITNFAPTSAYGDTDFPINEEDGMPAIGHIGPGARWEFELINKETPTEPAIQITERLGEIIPINGIYYCQLFTSSNGENEELLCYVRISFLKQTIKALPLDYENAEEYLIYSQQVRESWPANYTYSYLGIDGSLSNQEYNINEINHNYIKCCDYNYLSLTYNVYSNNGADRELIGSTNWINGIGTECGLINNLSCLDPKYTPHLLRMYNTNNQLVYEAQSADIYQLETPIISNTIKYHPDGSIFREGDKGIYIQNGKKYIQR